MTTIDNIKDASVYFQAAGLGHGGILGYIADRYPQGINDVDNDGRSPLHYAAAVRDDQHMYHTLVSLGADEAAVDNVSITQKLSAQLGDLIPVLSSTKRTRYFIHSVDCRKTERRDITSIDHKKLTKTF